jgi:hypothetical protein
MNPLKSAVLSLVMMASPLAAAPGDAAALAARLEGRYDNGAQYAAADPALKVPPSVAGKWLDFQHATFTRVAAPLLGGTVVYLEWRSAGPEGAISRQRIWRFFDTADGVAMDFYTIDRPERFAGKAAVPGAFAGLGPGDLKSYGPACSARFGADGRGRVDPARCVITANSGRTMAIRADIGIGGTIVSYSEAGILADGRFAFAVPPTEPYRFVRR